MIRLSNLYQHTPKPKKPWYKKWWVWSLIIILVPLTLLWMMTPYGFWSAFGAMVLGCFYHEGR